MHLVPRTLGTPADGQRRKVGEFRQIPEGHQFSNPVKVADGAIVTLEAISFDASAITAMKQAGTVLVVVDEYEDDRCVDDAVGEIVVPLKFTLYDSFKEVFRSSPSKRHEQKQGERSKALKQSSERALEVLRETILIFANRGRTPAWEGSAILGWTESGEYLMAEALWHVSELPSHVAPKMSTIGVIRASGPNSPEVIQLQTAPVYPSRTKDRVQYLAGLVPSGSWAFSSQ